MENARFIESERIYLREVRLEDVNEVYYLWMNDPEVTQFLESRFYPHSKESLCDFVSSMQGDRENIFLAIVLKENDRHIGNIKLGSIDWIHRFADVGLLIGEKGCWGQGYATEAIQLVMIYAFEKLNLHRLIAGFYATNVGSIKAFAKSGWEKEGVLRSHYFCNGTYVDKILMGVTYLDED